jgi:glycerol-3-phosphate dehydrogenase
MSQPNLQAGSRFDVAIVGAGVIGCALARALALAGARVVVLERGRDILSGASKGNSALFHTGYDAPRDSIELACIQRGREEFLAMAGSANLPLLETSAVLVAWSEEEASRLCALREHAAGNGVGDLVAVGADALYRRLPALGRGAHAGLVIPGEHVMDPWSTPLAYAAQALANGAVFERACEVRGGALVGGQWRIETSRGERRAAVVINAAGIHGDHVEGIVRESPFTIRPRKGQFVVLDKAAARLVPSVILPVPDERTKGVLVAPTIFGNVLIGPTAEEQDDRDRAEVDGATLARLLARGAEIVPGLAGCGVTAVYAGLRPATQFKDYVIEVLSERQWITVAGIRSTGLTAALGVAALVRERYESAFGAPRRPSKALSAPVPNLAEHRSRPWRTGGSGEIVCHCERVTRGEIEAALEGPLAARDVGGLRRRTRCMLGECQGFYCAGRIAALAGNRIHWPMVSANAA